jgi:hypothetical protein
MGNSGLASIKPRKGFRCKPTESTMSIETLVRPYHFDHFRSGSHMLDQQVQIQKLVRRRFKGGAHVIPVRDAADPAYASSSKRAGALSCAFTILCVCGYWFVATSSFVEGPTQQYYPASWPAIAAGHHERGEIRSAKGHPDPCMRANFMHSPRPPQLRVELANCLNVGCRAPLHPESSR